MQIFLFLGKHCQKVLKILNILNNGAFKTGYKLKNSMVKITSTCFLLETNKYGKTIIATGTTI